MGICDGKPSYKNNQQQGHPTVFELPGHDAQLSELERHHVEISRNISNFGDVGCAVIGLLRCLAAATPGSASAPTSESRLAVAPGGNDPTQGTPPKLTPLPSSPSAGRSAKPTPMRDQVTAEAIRMMEVLETSGQAMRELESVHFRLDNIVSFEMAGFPAVSAPTFLEGDYQAPDRYRYDGSLGPVLGTQFVSHVVVIGPRM